MKHWLPPEDTRADRVLQMMAVGFVCLAAFFVFTGLADSVDGVVNTRAGRVLRAESPDLFWKMVRTSFGFGGAMIGISARAHWAGGRCGPSHEQKSHSERVSRL